MTTHVQRCRSAVQTKLDLGYSINVLTTEIIRAIINELFLIDSNIMEPLQKSFVNERQYDPV